MICFLFMESVYGNNRKERKLFRPGGNACKLRAKEMFLKVPFL